MDFPFFLDQTIQILHLAAQTVLELFPYIVLGIIVGELLKYTSWIHLIYHFTKKNIYRAILFSAILGIISPLCTYGTIPVVLQLFRFGVPLAPLVVFLSASSLMNPQLFIITWGGINPEIAVMRLLTVFIFSLLLGYILYLFPGKSMVNEDIFTANHKAVILSDKCKKDFSFGQFYQDAWKMLQFVGFYVLIGILIGAIIQVFVPVQLISALFNPDQWFSVPLAAILGVPLYACGGGTIPLVDSLLSGGMAKGAALSFFLVGPATRITPLLSLASIIRPAYIGIYIVFLLIYSIIVGLVYT
jgi:uncharacterized membrane protein YraQ (UPF0718 family)